MSCIIKVCIKIFLVKFETELKDFNKYIQFTFRKRFDGIVEGSIK